MLQESRGSLVPVFLLQASQVLKETKEPLGGLETRDLRELKVKKGKTELGSLECSMCDGEGPHVPVVLR